MCRRPASSPHALHAPSRFVARSWRTVKRTKGATMKRVIQAMVALAGAVGLVAVTAGPAAAGASLNHAEPLLDAPRR
jgi:hypothetical protein